MPLLIVLLEEVLETGSRRRFVLAGVAGFAQALDLPAGLVPVPFLAVLSWFAARTLLFGYPLAERLRGLRASARDALPASTWLVLAVALAVLHAIPGGDPAPLHAGDVVAYAGLRHPGRYVDFVIGATPGLDFTSFCGYFTIGLAGLGLLLLPRARALRLVGALLGSLLVLGAGMVALYALVPGLRPSRPLPLGGPWIRLFVAFLAGYGLDRLLRRDAEARAPLLRTALGLFVAAAALAWLSGALILQNRAPEDALLALEGASPETQASWFSDTGFLSDTLGASALFSALAGGTLLLAAGARTLPFATALILFLHPLDVLSWKSRMTWLNASAAPSAWAPPPDLALPVASLLAILIGLALAGRIARERAP